MREVWQAGHAPEAPRVSRPAPVAVSRTASFVPGRPPGTRRAINAAHRPTDSVTSLLHFVTSLLTSGTLPTRSETSLVCSVTSFDSRVVPAG